MVKELTFEDEARAKLLSGASKLAQAVRTTLGPRGRSAVIDRSWGGPRVSKDGATVAEEVELKDRVENIGARMIREAGTLTARDAGDGSTTATVLAEAVFRKGMRQVMAGENPVLLQRALLSCTDRVCKKLEALSEPIEFQDSIRSVASIAANNDDRIGKTIASALDKVGNDGVCTIEEGKGIETTLEVEEGLYFDRGYISQQFVADPDSAEIRLENPYILIMEDKISNLAQIVPVLEKVVEKRKSLLIIAEDIDGEALTTLVVNSQRGVLKVAAVKAPGYGDRRKAGDNRSGSDMFIGLFSNHWEDYVCHFEVNIRDGALRISPRTNSRGGGVGDQTSPMLELGDDFPLSRWVGVDLEVHGDQVMLRYGDSSDEISLDPETTRLPSTGGFVFFIADGTRLEIRDVRVKLVSDTRGGGIWAR